ncbi:hypothetical protein V5O48_001979 [Marasmius crinis-equi]|uniref:Uncharacterized protein n=1 Tax=Marasmius crinis-equi TaxID=585013 RepID=A0ABR3FX28_9AGAR
MQLTLNQAQEREDIDSIFDLYGDSDQESDDEDWTPPSTPMAATHTISPVQIASSSNWPASLIEESPIHTEKPLPRTPSISLSLNSDRIYPRSFKTNQGFVYTADPENRSCFYVNPEFETPCASPKSSVATVQVADADEEEEEEEEVEDEEEEGEEEEEADLPKLPGPCELAKLMSTPDFYDPFIPGKPLKPSPRLTPADYVSLSDKRLSRLSHKVILATSLPATLRIRASWRKSAYVAPSPVCLEVSPLDRSTMSSSERRMLRVMRELFPEEFSVTRRRRRVTVSHPL